MCLVEDMINTLDGCDLLEKVVIMTNILEHNDVTVSIKVQQFRCRYAKYVYYNCTRVLCECHGYKRHCEPSRIPVKMLKRHYKVFDSHARDIYGKSHPQGTCALLDIIFIIYRRLSASALHSKFIWSK